MSTTYLIGFGFLVVWSVIVGVFVVLVVLHARDMRRERRRRELRPRLELVWNADRPSRGRPVA